VGSCTGTKQDRAVAPGDPDGNLVNLFTPVTQAAIAKFSR
jgi:hypothetical protein